MKKEEIFDRIKLIFNVEVTSLINPYENKWISIEEAANYLGVNKDTIRNWIKKDLNGIPAHKIGKQWKLKRSEIDEWIKSGQSAID